MMRDELKSEPVPWGLALLCAMVLYACTLVLGSRSLDLTLGDTDDALRLVQLREFLTSGNWYNLHTDRLSPPFGYTSHWSRLPDMLMAGIYFAVRPFSSAEFAERAMRAFYPGLWVIPSAIGIGLLAFHFAKHRLVFLVTLFLLATNGTTFPQFLAGRIDHHNVQIALSVLTVASAAMVGNNWRLATAAGVCSGLLLTIGLEGMPFLCVAAAAICVRYVYSDGDYKAIASYAASIGLTTLLGLAISLPPQRWFETACDVIAFNLAAAVFAGSLLLFCCAVSSKMNRTLSLRAISVGLSGFVAASIYLILDPACLHGPFGHMLPALKPAWLDHVAEMQPVFNWHDMAKNIRNSILVAIVPPTILSAFWLLSIKKFRSDSTFVTLFAAFLVSLVVGLLNLRMANYIVWFGTPILCVGLFQIVEGARGRKLPLMAAVLSALSPLVLQICSGLMISQIPQTSDQVKSVTKECLQSNNYSDLAKLPKGVVLSELNLGSHILALTPHSVLAAPYHRIGNNILTVKHFFDDDTLEQARQVSEEFGLSYIVICNGDGSDRPSTSSASLYEALRADRLPDWLEAVGTIGKNPIRVFRVNKGHVGVPELRTGMN